MRDIRTAYCTEHMTGSHCRFLLWNTVLSWHMSFRYNIYAHGGTYMELNTGTVLHGFRVERIREIDDCSGVLYEMTHLKTGAQLCWMKREDENKTFVIAFKTIPENDTGVFHILEHSVLNGSKKYPVREPFVELLKSSMQTFLNAFTYPDKTMYPVSSRNPRDFMNLMSVYLDAVFNPAIYENPNIFYQEGWHYEIRDEKDEPVYKGVVLNEMKGSFSSVDETLVDTMNRKLFPDNCYRFVSGGDPEYITDLSYEQFIETHKRFYHPSNARVFLDGNLNIDETLAYIDDEYFSKYEKEDFDFDIPMQKVTNASVSRYEYEITEDEDPKDRTQIALAKVVSSFECLEKNIAWAALISVLVGNNESKLKKAIIDSGLGQDVELDLFDGIQQPWAVLTIRNTNEENYDEIRKVLRETAEQLIREGISREQLTASLNMMEFRYREKREPAGLSYAQRAMETWLYGGDPAMNLSASGLFEKLRQKASEGYYEELLKEFLLDDEHISAVIAVPSTTLLEEKSKREKEKLHAAKESWQEKISDYIELNRKLDVWQQTPDSEEAIATLPRLFLSDVSPLPYQGPKHRETAIRGVPALIYDEQPNGIVYLNLYFNLGGITKQSLPALGFYSALLGSLPTKNKSLEDLQEAVRRDLGALSFFLDAYTPEKTREACIPVLCVATSALKQNIHKAVDLILEIIHDTVFDQEKILNLLKQENESCRQSLIMNGHGVAMRRVSARCSAEGVFREYVGGYESALFEKELENDYENRIGAFINDCELFSEIIFSPARLTMSMTGEYKELAETLIDGLNNIDAQRAKVHYPLEKPGKEAIVIPAAVSYSAAGINLADINGKYDPRMLVLSHMMSFDYLWNTVRVQGGAYGTGFSVNVNGSMAAYSYRDPNPLNALSAYRGAAQYLREETGDDIEQLIIGALASTEPLLSPASAIRVEDTRYFRGTTYEARCEGRKKVLSMNADDLRAFADQMETAMNEASVCIVGSRETINACAEENLTELKPL